jgi:regulator of protease activity HflC (stomatin/prohibitin superfamily)
MAKFDRWEHRYGDDGYSRRTEEELNQMEAEFNEKQNLKFKIMLKSILGGVAAVVVLIFLVASCERIDAGHVGVKVNLYGDDKGVADVTEVTGMVFYNPFTSNIFEFPTFIQHKEYTGDNSFVVNSKDGSEFHVSPIINYSVKRERVPYIFAKYRRSLEQIEEGFLKTSVFDAFRLATNKYTADQLIGNRQAYEIEVRRILELELLKEGFIINQFTSNLLYPDSFKNAINAKNNAVQAALMAENKVKQAEAEAKIKIATAEGNAQSLLVQSRAEAEANQLKQKTLTTLLIQQQFIDKWDGALPQYGTVPQLFRDINK